MGLFCVKMLTYSGLQSQCQDLASDTTSESLVFFKRNINLGLSKLQTELGAYYTEDTWTDSTLASTNSYQTPEDFVRLKSLYITVGGIQYPLEEVFDESLWRQLQSSATSSTSNIPQKVFVRRETYEIYPTPSSASNTITMIYESGGSELTADDYSTGTILTLANGSTALTASNTTFTSAMAGRYLRITNDGGWYKIGAYLTATTLTLAKKYQGISIAAGSEAYILGQVPNTPPSTHILPVYFSLWQYYKGPKQDSTMANTYKDDWETGLKEAKATYGRRYSTRVIPSQRNLRKNFGVINPNFFPKNMS